MLSITKHTDFHFGSWNVGQPDRPAETLILLGVIVLEPNLELNCLSEVTLLLLTICGNHSDGFPQRLTLKLTAIM